MFTFWRHLFGKISKISTFSIIDFTSQDDFQIPCENGDQMIVFWCVVWMYFPLTTGFHEVYKMADLVMSKWCKTQVNKFPHHCFFDIWQVFEEKASHFTPFRISPLAKLWQEKSVYMLSAPRVLHIEMVIHINFPKHKDNLVSPYRFFAPAINVCQEKQLWTFTIQMLITPLSFLG